MKSPAAKALADEFRTAQFPNGFRVIHKQVDRPVTHLGLVINAGSRDELAGESGAAHFIEHTLFKGTKKRKAYHVLNRLDSVGADGLFFGGRYLVHQVGLQVVERGVKGGNLA